jgi:hypothetical protein
MIPHRLKTETAVSLKRPWARRASAGQKLRMPPAKTLMVSITPSPAGVRLMKRAWIWRLV